jgi:hypothetical protein
MQGNTGHLEKHYHEFMARVCKNNSKNRDCSADVDFPYNIVHFQY